MRANRVRVSHRAHAQLGHLPRRQRASSGHPGGRIGQMTATRARGSEPSVPSSPGWAAFPSTTSRLGEEVSVGRRPSSRGACSSDKASTPALPVAGARLPAGRSTRRAVRRTAPCRRPIGEVVRPRGDRRARTRPPPDAAKPHPVPHQPELGACAGARSSSRGRTVAGQPGDRDVDVAPGRRGCVGGAATGLIAGAAVRRGPA